MPAPPRASGHARALCAGLFLATLAVFSPLRHAGFLNYDDNTYVTDNAVVREGLTWRGLQWAASSLDFNWHPVTWLSHMLDCQLYGLNPAGHHLSSVLLHAANAALLLCVLLRLTGDPWPAAFAAALFAFHPLHVEPAAWISARKDLLSTLFWLAAILAYVRYAARRTRGAYALVFLCMLLSLMSKGMAVTLPFTLLLLDHWPLGRFTEGEGSRASSARALVVEKTPLFALALAGMVVQVVAQRAAGGLRTLEEVPLPVRLANSLLSYVAYLGKMLWPVGLAVPYPLRHEAPPVWEVAAAGVCLLLLTAAVVAARRMRPHLFVGWLWYVITIAPVIGLVQIGHQSMADRYTYVPLVGLFVAAAWEAAWLGRASARARRALAAAGVAAVGVCAWLARLQLEHWRDNLSLFAHTLAVTRDNELAENNYGAALNLAGRREEARAHFAAALRLDPANAWALANLAGLLIEDGRVDEGEEYLREASRRMPSEAGLRVSFGLARLRRGDFDGARGEFEAVLRARPGDASALLGLGQALEALGRTEEALAAFRGAARGEPALPEAHFRYGVALEQAGRRDEAIAEYRAEISSNPRHAEAHNNLGSALRALGRGDEARERFAASVSIDPANVEARSNLGVALMEADRLDEAETQLREAVRLRPDYFEATMNLGVLGLRAKDPLAAEERFRRASELRPDSAVARYFLAQVLESLGRDVEALGEYRKALEIDPGQAAVRFRLARLEETLGATADAVRDYREVLRLDPAHEPASAALERLNAR